MANPMLEALHGMLWSKGIRIGKLSGTGRTVAAMLNRADTVPFPGSQMHDHCMTVARVPARKFYYDARILFDVQNAVQRWYGMDGCTVVTDVYNFEVEALGAKFIYSDNAMPTVDTDHPLISGPQDLAKMKPLDPSKGRVPMAVELAGIITKAGGPLLAGGMFCSPFSLMCQAMGYPRSIRALRKEPQFARDLFAYIENDVILPFVKAQHDGGGAKKATGADAWSCIPNLTPDMVQEWVITSALRLKAKGKADLDMDVNAGAAAADYCEEDPAKFDRALMWRCFDLANQLQFLGTGKMAFMGMGRTQDWDPHWVQDYALSDGPGKKALIYAGLNGRFLRDSKPMEIAAKVRQWIDIMGREGKLAVAGSNIPADTPPVNVFTAVHAAHTYGRWPIAQNLEAVPFQIPQFSPFDKWLQLQPEEEIIRKAREK